MLIKGFVAAVVESWSVTHQEISDEAWVVLEPLLPAVRTAGRSWTDHRGAVEGMVWK